MKRKRSDSRAAEGLEPGSLPADLLLDLFPGQEALLFHLLVCDVCRGRATAVLLARHGVKLVLPVGQLGTLLADPCHAGPRPELAAEGLLGELLAQPREAHFDLVEEEPRFRSAELVELMLARSREQQLEDPELGEDMASLAGRVAQLTFGEDAEEELATVLTRAGALMANARRLAGRPEEAEAVLGNTMFHSAPAEARALFYRSLGLARWEQGRTTEGAGSLQEAARLYGEARRPGEEGEALTLLGLLYAEEARVPQCAAALLAGLPLLVEERRPWLTARACLTLAGALADMGCPDEAWSVLNKGRKLAGGEDDPAEAAFLDALQGTVLASLGEREKARELLDRVFRKHLSEARLPEAALAGLELALVLAELDRAAEAEGLAAELEARFPGVAAAGEAVSALRSTPWTDRSGLRRVVETERVVLRRLFRMHRLYPRPLPYA